MLPDRVSNPGPLTYESGALPIALRGPACFINKERNACISWILVYCSIKSLFLFNKDGLGIIYGINGLNYDSKSSTSIFFPNIYN